MSSYFYSITHHSYFEIGSNFSLDGQFSGKIVTQKFSINEAFSTDLKDASIHEETNGKSFNFTLDVYTSF